MKTDTLKNISMYLIAASAAFLLSGGFKQCNGGDTLVQAPSPQTEYEAGLDSAVTALLGEKAYLLDLLKAATATGQTKVVTITKYVTVTDRVLIPSPTQVDTPVMIMWADEYPWPDSLRLYEGIVQGDSAHCTYQYLVGIQGDSLHFIAVNSKCDQKQEVMEVINPNGPYLSNFLPELDPRVRLGAKTGWFPADGSTQYGVQAAYRGIYAAANFAPRPKKWLFEAGFLLPVGKKDIETKQ